MISFSSMCNRKIATILVNTQRNLLISKSKEMQQSNQDNIYIQLLPIVELTPTSALPQGRILLCKWSKGDFQGRYTGLIQLWKQQVLSSDKTISGDTILEKIESIAKDMIPREMIHSIEKVDLVGILKFDGPPRSNEYVYTAKLKTDSMEAIEKLKIEFDNQHPCFWFDWKDIPYQKMPADDILWYPQVLWGSAKVTGSFTFGGMSERKLKSYELRTVENFD